jgi:CDP-diacylglycerol--glycerol-3-phosphate 3-phosphatidyltransferase
MLHKFKSNFEKIIAPICYVFRRWNISPNWITFLGLLLILSASVAFALRAFYWAVILCAIGGILDGVDGKIARDMSRTTLWGGFLDSTFDRFSEIGIGLGILYSYISTPLFSKAAFLVFLAITGSLMTSYIRARGQGIGCDPKKGLLQRPERGIVLAIGALVSHKALLFCVGLVAIGSYFTVMERIIFIWKNQRVQ